MKQVISIYLYGSMSTGKSNEYSDVDILVIYKNKLTHSQKQKIEKQVGYKFKYRNLDISYYRLDQIKKMAEEGSLLIWHIYLEGKLLEGEILINLVETISDFKHYEECFFVYRKLYLDLKNKICKNDFSLFDINLTAVLLRNLLILASNKQGEKKFDKNEVFEDCKNIINGLNHVEQEYQELLNIRSYYKTGKGKGIDIEIGTEIFSKVKNDYFEVLEMVMDRVGHICNMNSDLQISYIMTSKVDFSYRYQNFENSIYLERGIYNILSKRLPENSLPSRKTLEINDGAIFKEGINLLFENKIYRKMSSNYDEQPAFLSEREKKNNENIEINDRLLSVFFAINKLVSKITFGKIKKIISSSKISDIEYENEILNAENNHLKNLKKFIIKYDDE